MEHKVTVNVRGAIQTAGVFAQRCGLAGALALLLLAPGCASHADRIAATQGHYFRGDLPAARTELDLLLKKPKRDADALLLDQAMVELSSGRPKEAERLLRTVRDHFDHLEQKDLAEGATSMLTDDTRLAYSGEDHEKVLVRAFLALSNLMADGGDAEAYSLQVNAKQKELIERAGGLEAHPELAATQVALGPYLRAMLQEESRVNADEVVRNRAMVASWQPEFRDAQVDLARAETTAPCAPGHGVIYVFALVGRGPAKQERLEIPTQAALLVADRIVSAVGKHNLPPTIAPIRIPVVVRQNNRIDRLQVAIDDQPKGDTATLVDVGMLAETHFQAKAPEIIGRAVARRVLKKAAVYAAKEATGANTAPGIDIALTLAGIAWEATEAPDTRCWSLLPDRIQVLRIEAPAGEHYITLTPADSYGRFGYSALSRVTVSEGRNTSVLVNFPDSHLVGEVLTSDWSVQRPAIEPAAAQQVELP
ncbi:hypothetical protein Pan44_10040 [Caulifigura coniformis]|uniref:Uncharacterized protein n=1 Tax=Caulifigura coniformis TaxID=2527983 RepID=A0A517SA32_9PLAN|nr:hypothetical protein [Caulifigura coniformis]QDT52990.1 hypothetical protein Pan44_10040 [Caulifigura coniformis]